MKKISIGNRTYNVELAISEEEKEIGLSNISYLPEDEGMLFVYDEEEDELGFTMEDTSIPLDIIFINDDEEVISIYTKEPFDKEPVFEDGVKYVLEVNPNSGIKIGDELETEEDKEHLKNNKMLVLNENGDVQMKLEGGERIFSRISTKKIIKQAYKAYKSDKDKDYIKLGKIVIEELNNQDNREPDYVQAPN